VKDTVISSRLLKLLTVSATAAALSGSAFADEEVERAARLAIREVIRKSSPRSLAVFTETETSFHSFSEANITGKGYLSTSGQWSVESFTYRVKVRRVGDNKTHKAVVTLSNGNKWTSEKDRAEKSRDFIGYFTKPRHFTKLASGDVKFEGYGTIPKVDVRIYDRNNRSVERKQVNVLKNRWNTSFKLKDGTYRAVLGSADKPDSDEVRFSVNDDSRDWGLPKVEELVTIRSPRENDTVSSATD